MAAAEETKINSGVLESVVTPPGSSASKKGAAVNGVAHDDARSDSPAPTEVSNRAVAGDSTAPTEASSTSIAAVDGESVRSELLHDIAEADAGEPAASSGEPPSTADPNGKASEVIPSDPQLHGAIQEARQSESGQALGVPKLLAKIKEANPKWTLSEKRLRKFLSQNPNLSVLAQQQSRPVQPVDPLWIPDYVWHVEYDEGSGEGSNVWPTSSIDDDLLLECKQKKVEPVRFQEPNKGSGLIAKEKLVKGGLVFKEDAYVWVPGSKYVVLAFPRIPHLTRDLRNLTKAIAAGQACAFCGRLFSTVRHKAQVSCPHHADHWASSLSKKQPRIPTQGQRSTQSRGQNSAGGYTLTEKPGGPEPCYQRFCNRVCATKSADTYGPLVCPQMNPEYQHVVGHSNSEDYRSPHLIFKLYASMLIANERGELPKSEEDATKTAAVESPTANGLPAANGDAAEATEEAGEAQTATEGGAAAPKKSKKGKGKKKTSGIVAVPANDTISDEAEKVLRRIEGLATIGDRARREKGGGSAFAAQLSEIRYGQAWKLSWHLVVRALHLDTGYRPKLTGSGSASTSGAASASGNKEKKDGAEAPTEGEPSETDLFWASYWKRRLSPKLIAKYFGIARYMELLGMAGLNTEDDHGIYLLHARINRASIPCPSAFKLTLGRRRQTRVSPTSRC